MNIYRKIRIAIFTAILLAGALLILGAWLLPDPEVLRIPLYIYIAVDCTLSGVMYQLKQKEKEENPQ